MKLFALIVFICFFLSIVIKGEFSQFSKDKVTPVRGILAIFIILHHVYLCSHYGFLSEFKSWGAISVSMFLFISGYGLTKSYQIKGASYLKGFIKNRLCMAILLPCAVVILLQALIALVSGNCVTFLGLLKNNGERWFIVAIIYLYLSFYLAARARRMLKNIIIICLVLAYVLVAINLDLGRCWYISIWGFVVGNIYAENESLVVKKFNQHKILYYLTVPALMGLMAICYVLGVILPSSVQIAFSMVYAIVPMVFALILQKLEVSRLAESKILNYLSRISYELYLTHGVVILLLGKVGMFSDNGVLFLVSVLLLTVCLAAFVRFICDKLLTIAK